MSTALLYGCSEATVIDSEPIEEKEVKAVDQSEDKDKNEHKDVDDEVKTDQSDFKKIISDNIAEDDKVKEFKVEDGIVYASIQLAEGMLDDATTAEAHYSSISDNMLSVEGWNTLTINFENVGEISFKRDEAESNEYGSYFPTERIMEKLGIN